MPKMGCLLKAQESITVAVSLSNATDQKNKINKIGLLKTYKLQLKIKTLCVQFDFPQSYTKADVKCFCSKSNRNTAITGRFFKQCCSGSKIFMSGKAAKLQGLSALCRRTESLRH